MDNTGSYRLLTTNDAGLVERFVWPITGILANINLQWSKGQFVGESGINQRKELRELGYKVRKVRPVWTQNGHSGFAIVEFGNDISAYSEASRCEMHFKERGRGRKSFFDGGCRDQFHHFWMAREEDFHDGSVIGERLRQIGQMKSLQSLFLEEGRIKLDCQGESSSSRTGQQELVNQIEQEHIMMKSLVRCYADVTEDIYKLKLEIDQFQRVINVLKRLATTHREDKPLMKKINATTLEVSMKENRLGRAREMHDMLHKHMGELMNHSGDPTNRDKMQALREEEMLDMIRYAGDVPEEVLWNANEGRRATLMECVSSLIDMHKKP